jgi:prepilin signal peptidase PulO-like enzyme (type II secretory pathway)
MSPVTLIVVGLIGVLVGGIVNALADDLPQRRNPHLPHYPDDTPRPLVAWLGISAFLLGKRTSPGGARLSWRYPITEVVTSLAMILVIARTSAGQPPATAWQVVFWLVYMAIFVLITVIDLEHKLILFVVIIPSAVVALVDAVLTRLQP